MADGPRDTHPPDAAAGSPSEVESSRNEPASATLSADGPPELSLNRELGTSVADRYELVDVLGHGASGVVYRARDTELDVEIALKVIQPRGERELRRFKREIVTARALQHENIIRIFDFGVSGRDAFISMELLTGGTLDDRIREGPIPYGEAMEIGLAIARALAEAHKNGIVHRDLKPHNVLFTPGRKQPKLADFGIARDLSAQQTQTMSFEGTPYYMAPEAADGKRPTPQSDVYSLGVLLFQLFTGRLPFQSDSFVKLAMMHTQKAPPRPRSLNTDIPPDVEAIILTCLEKDPSHRFADAGEVAAALQGDPLTLAHHVRRSRRRRWKPLFIGGASAALSLAVAAAVYLWAPGPWHATDSPEVTPSGAVAMTGTPAPATPAKTAAPTPKPTHRRVKARAHRTPVRHRSTPAPVKSVRMTVKVIPWGYVRIDGGKTRMVEPPRHMTLTVKPGTHVIRAWNDKTNQKKEKRVRVGSGRNNTVVIDLSGP